MLRPAVFLTHEQRGPVRANRFASAFRQAVGMDHVAIDGPEQRQVCRVAVVPMERERVSEAANRSLVSWRAALWPRGADARLAYEVAGAGRRHGYRARRRRCRAAKRLDVLENSVRPVLRRRRVLCRGSPTSDRPRRRFQKRFPARRVVASTAADPAMGVYSFTARRMSTDAGSI